MCWKNVQTLRQITKLWYPIPALNSNIILHSLPLEAEVKQLQALKSSHQSPHYKKLNGKVIIQNAGDKWTDLMGQMRGHESQINDAGNALQGNITKVYDPAIKTNDSQGVAQDTAK